MYKFEFELYMLYLYEKKYVLRTCRSFVASANPKSANVKLVQLCKFGGFMICGTYLRAIHYWYMYKLFCPRADSFEGLTPMSLYLEMALLQPFFCTQKHLLSL
jgi:hypothetical protein